MPVTSVTNTIQSKSVADTHANEPPFKKKLLIHHVNGQTLLLRKVKLKLKPKTYSNTKSILPYALPSVVEIKSENENHVEPTIIEIPAAPLPPLPSVVEIKSENEIHVEPTITEIPAAPLPPPITVPKVAIARLKTHRQVKNPRRKTYKCDICQRLFISNLTYMSHIKWHESPRNQPVTCPECGRIFSRAPILERHIMCVHKKLKPYVCENCGMAYGQRCQLSAHIDKEHIRELKHKCVYCSQTFISSIRLSLHKHKKHPAMVKKRTNFNPNEMRAATKKTRQYRRRTCDHPPKNANAEYARKSREKQDELLRLKLPPLCCQYCGAILGDLAEKQKHERDHINDADRRYKCDVCGHFVQKLAVHKLKHTDMAKSCQCAVCGQKFGRKMQLIVHELWHNGEKLFACDVCGNKFTYMAMLKIHLRSHTGEKPYKCAECGAQFKSTVLRQRHATRTEHKIKDDRQTATQPKTIRMQSHTVVNENVVGSSSISVC